ncbi:hypothetical protein FQR65_LT18648 [Abscondita terminalis]|nr:hypothetical protein FQR65_LT18648 [Abscondita terminalis]
MKVAIIGAGVSGILSLKYILESGFECDCFEETDTFGGTWVYTPNSNTDEYGLPVYRSMYKNLLTTLPKEFMTFSNFPYPEHVSYSYLTSSDVLSYLSEYVHYFKLEKHICYFSMVTKVQPENNMWMVTVKNLITNTSNSKLYDFVFVCSGHFRFPRVPVIPCQHLFQGIQMHSRYYRSPDIFQNKRVLLIGASFSGIDIAKQIVGHAKSVFLSHWNPPKPTTDGITNKPTVTKFEKSGVIFVDGSNEDIDVVIYSTGYEYKFPFLAESCGITASDNWVRPLYKHVVNIQHPTMMFIGIPYLTAMFIISEFQVQFAMAILKKAFCLPSKQYMETELLNYVKHIEQKDGDAKHVHKFGLYQRHYLTDLVKTAGLKPIPCALHDLYDYLVLHADKIKRN